METTSDDASVTVGLVGITVIVEPVAPAGGVARVVAVAEGVAAAAVDVGEAAGGVILGEPYRDAEVPPEVAVVGSPAPTVGVYAGNVDGFSPAPLCEQPATLNDSAATMTSEKSRDFGTGTPGGRRDNRQSGDPPYTRIVPDDRKDPSYPQSRRDRPDKRRAQWPKRPPSRESPQAGMIRGSQHTAAAPA
jgi:hypothetical protein